MRTSGVCGVQYRGAASPSGRGKWDGKGEVQDTLGRMSEKLRAWSESWSPMHSPPCLAVAWSVLQESPTMRGPLEMGGAGGEASWVVKGVGRRQVSPSQWDVVPS